MTINWDFKEEFRFLCALREAGPVNMFGAVPYIVDEFNCTRIHAMNALINWMENFAEIDAHFKRGNLE
jgi:hypothetical protein